MGRLTFLEEVPRLEKRTWAETNQSGKDESFLLFPPPPPSCSGRMRKKLLDVATMNSHNRLICEKCSHTHRNELIALWSNWATRRGQNGGWEWKDLVPFHCVGTRQTQLPVDQLIAPLNHAAALKIHPYLHYFPTLKPEKIDNYNKFVSSSLQATQQTIN